MNVDGVQVLLLGLNKEKGDLEATHLSFLAQLKFYFTKKCEYALFKAVVSAALEAFTNSV